MRVALQGAGLGPDDVGERDDADQVVRSFGMHHGELAGAVALQRHDGGAERLVGRQPLPSPDELGHRDAKSVQSYLDRAEQFDPADSIFYRPPEPWVDTKVATNPSPLPAAPQDSGSALC